MRLTIKNISAFLMEKGLLKAKSVVDGDFLVTQSQNRNAIFRIHIKNDKSLFVKQLVNFDPQNTYFLQKDATCLWLIKNEKTFSQLAKYVPEYYGYDPEKQVLIVEYLPNAKNMEEVFQANGYMSVPLLEQAAKVMSTYHFKLEDKTLTNRAVQFFMRQLPWTFNYALNPKGEAKGYFGNSPVFTHIKNNPAFLEAMKTTSQLYKVSTLIHGDIKNVNFILKDETDPKSLKLIDWEIADVGDPLWDVAGMIQSLIVSQFLRVNAAQASNPYQSNQIMTQEQMNQSMSEVATFWKAYSKYQKFTADKNKTALDKAIRFAGMRLIQTAFEHNMASQQIIPNASKFLQLSFSLMQNSETIAPQILHLTNLQYETVH